jgi:serine protease inhibitor
MELTARFRYARGEGYQTLRLPYGDGAFAMYVLLPDSGRALGDIAALRDSAAWGKSLTGYATTEVHVVLPKFTMRSQLALDESQKAAGLSVAYDSSRAEFFRMVPNDGRTRAWIVRVLQATMMQVSERGTEAAAATAVVMGATQSVARVVDFIVDRPFVVTIRDERSGVLLFIGQIVDPQ